LHEPQRLLQSARSSPQPSSAQVIDLARVRAERKRRTEKPRFFQRQRVVLAASLAGGLLIGALGARLVGTANLTRYRDGVLIADGSLADALDHQLAGHALPGSTVHVHMSFKDKQGAFCRTFSVGPSGLAGLACRADDGWRLVSMVDTHGEVAAAVASASATPAASTTAASSAIPSAPTAATPLAAATPSAAAAASAVATAGTAGVRSVSRGVIGAPPARSASIGASRQGPAMAARAHGSLESARLLREAVAAHIDGAPLDAQAEARARGLDWR
jgi:hypothetical protein